MVMVIMIMMRNEYWMDYDDGFRADKISIPSWQAYKVVNNDDDDGGDDVDDDDDHYDNVLTRSTFWHDKPTQWARMNGDRGNRAEMLSQEWRRQAMADEDDGDGDGDVDKGHRVKTLSQEWRRQAKVGSRKVGDHHYQSVE